MGAEISRYLEQDAALGVNGVVSEDVVAVRDGGLQSVRRTAADVARRAQLFEFCKDWPLERVVEFLRWYTHLVKQARSGQSDSDLDLAEVADGVDQAERLALDVAALEALLAQLDEEIQVYASRQEDAARSDESPSPQDKEGTAATAPSSTASAEILEELQTRRQSAQQEFRSKKDRLRELQVHLVASLDGVDFRRPLEWQLFVKAVTQVHLQGDAVQVRRSTAERHPACSGFEMRRADQAKGQLDEYRKGDIVLPPPDSHEIDGHTDDSASSSAVSVDESDGDDDEDDSDGGEENAGGEGGEAAVNASNAGSNEQKSLQAVNTTTGNSASDSDEYDSDEVAATASPNSTPVQAEILTDLPKSIENDAKLPTSQEPPTETSSNTKGGEADGESTVAKELLAFKQSLKNARIIKRAVPDAFNPEYRHPACFGYSFDKQTPFVNEKLKEQADLDERENKVFAAKIESLRATLDSTVKAEQGKLDAFDQRERDLVAKRAKHWEKRHAELERAKRELDPNDMYFRTFEAQDRRAKEQEAFDDEEIRRLRQNTETRIKVAREQCETSIAYIQTVRATDKPLGEIRLKFHEKEMERYQVEVNEAKRSLDAAREEYVALKTTKIRVPGQNSKQRAQLLFAEDQIKSRESNLERVCQVYESEQFLFERAQQMFEREQRFVPLYNCAIQSKAMGAEESRRAVLLDLAILLLLGVVSSSIDSKTKLLFEMFSRKSDHPRYHSGGGGDTLQVLTAGAFAHILRLLVDAMTRLGDIQLPYALTQSFFQSTADREFLNLNLLPSFSNSKDDNQDCSNQDEEEKPSNMTSAATATPGMTYFEFHKFCLDTIDKSKYLCQLLGHPWRFEQLSRFVIQHMSATHQYSLGLINVNDLKYSVARQLIQPRGELSRWKLIVVHERALAMGENDPLKTDYSKYLPKRRTKLLSKVVPLDHGGYRNLLHYRMQVIIRSAVKLQTIWRAKKGRQVARLAAEKQAFYHARGLALAEARRSVETEWAEKGAKPAHSVEKMKFEAKIRMKQVKLRTKGNAFSREQVLALMVEEAVQNAQKEVESRFREMEEELGYISHYQALNVPHVEMGYLKQEIAKGLIAQLVHAKQEPVAVIPLLENIAANEQRAREKAEQKKKKKKELKKTGDDDTSDAADVPETDSAVEELHFTDSTSSISRRALSQARTEQMAFGRFPPDLYVHGRSKDEDAVMMLYSVPDPALTKLQDRLKRVCCGMTDFKMAEMLEELPSKRHMCEYVSAFRHTDGSYDVEALERDLFEHFRMVRGSQELAEALVNFEQSDLEFGLSRALVSDIEKGTQTALRTMVGLENGAIARENASVIAKKLTRMGFKMIGGPANDNDDEKHSNTDEKDREPGNNQAEDEHPARVLVQKARHTLEERRKQAREAQARMVEAMKAWKDAEMSLLETEHSQLEVRDAYPVLPVNRTKWAERLQFALRLSEGSPQEIQVKYTEILQVCQDFIETATATALTLVREYHLPVRQKSVLPVGESFIDGRRDEVRGTARLKYEAHDILFKLCTDDHGRFEGSHELSAKFGGHEVRNSGLYVREIGLADNVLLPLQCVVDFEGYRVLCASKVPIEIITWGDSGGIQKRAKQLVHGSDNRGKTVIFQSKEVDKVLASAAGRLNLSKHGVRGYQDLTSKVLHAPADLLGYINGKKQMVLLNFARAMPPEDPELTAGHLVQSTRGMSILWRQLRPELVAGFPTPLSSDALSCLTYCAPDWQKQALGVEEATRHLLNDVIPAFARKLSQQQRYFDAPSFSLTLEMHRHGINVRHLGLLRSCFFFPLAGTATLQYASAEIQTTEDFTREVDRGSFIYIDGKTGSAVSTDPSRRFDATCITITTKHTGDSRQNVIIYSGRADCRERASAIRALLLAEMVARTFKNLLRHFLRVSTRSSGTGLTPFAFKEIVVQAFNLLSGSRSGSDAFYNTHMFEGVRGRFGPRAVSEVDKQNMRKTLLPHMRYIVARVAVMMGISMSPLCLERVNKFPDGYVFVVDDLVANSAGISGSDAYRVKHNLVLLDFSMASLLLLHATIKQAITYRRLVLADTPHGYWPLCERRGTLTAGNLGEYGASLTGKYLPGCVLEGDGPILNADMNRALQLQKESRSYVSFPFVADRYPNQQDPQAHVSVEVWCRCDGHESTRRVVLTLGRFSLSALKMNMWAFSINVSNIDIYAYGAQVVLQKWTHLVGTFDGTMLRLYVDGFLQNEVEVDAVVDQKLQKREEIIQKTREDIDNLENEVKGRCFKEVDREMQLFFATKEGRRQVKEISQKFLDEHDFRVRISKSGAANGDGGAASKSDDASGGDEDEASRSPALPGSPSSPKKRDPAPAATQPLKRDLSKASRSDFEPLAKKQLLREKFDAQWAIQSMEFQEMRRRVNDKIQKEIDEQLSQDARPLRIGCLSSARRRDGKYFFHGSVAHVAYYNGRALTRDQINAHYVMGTRDRAHESDHLFALASSRFSRALQYAPDDKQMLAKFAENVCASLKYDLDHQHAQELYKKKVKCGVQPLVVSENVHGIAEILKNLPRDPAFSGLFIFCYKSLTRIRPDYFQAVESEQCRLALKELARLPFAFFLGSRSANSLVNIMSDYDHDDDEKEILELFADVICRVLHVYPSFYGDGLTNMHWLTSLSNPRAVVYFVLALEAGEDARCVNLQDVTSVSDSDMEIIARNNTFCTAFMLANCTLLSDVALQRVAVNCTQLEVLDASNCNLITDNALIVLGSSCRRLVKLWLVSCHQIRDAGVEAAVRANDKLEEIGLSFCERISDRSIAVIAKSCLNLAVLEVELCIQLTSSGMKCLAAMHANPTSLRKLNVAGCRRIGDEGMLQVAKRCTRLRQVNVRQCDKLTDASMRALIHNCLELELLNMEEVCAATYKLFVFDQEGDGRGNVDKNMVRKLRDLHLAGCSGLNDLALGHLAHRAKQIEVINVSTCENLTDQALMWLREDMLDRSASGTALARIDLSHCPQFSPSAIRELVVHCPNLVSLNLSGCVHLSEEHLSEIIASCPKLTRLELDFCREVSDKTLEAMAANLALEELSLSRCSRITDDGMLDVAAQFTGLRRLDVSACKKLTDKTIGALYESARSLKELDVTHCPLFSPEALARFVKRNAKVVSRKLEALQIGAAVEQQKHLSQVSKRLNDLDDDDEDCTLDYNGNSGKDEGSGRSNVSGAAKKHSRSTSLQQLSDQELATKAAAVDSSNLPALFQHRR